MELVRQDGLFEGTFAHETGDRNEPLRHCEGFSQLPDDAQKLISQVRRGEKTSVLLYLKNAFLLFEHKQGGEPDPTNNNKRVGYQLYRYSLQNYPGLSETLLSETLRQQTLAESVSENVQEESFEKAETPISAKLDEKAKTPHQILTELGENRQALRQILAKLDERQFLCQILADYDENKQQQTLDEDKPRLTEPLPESEQSPVPVFFTKRMLWFFIVLFSISWAGLGMIGYQLYEINRKMSHSGTSRDSQEIDGSGDATVDVPDHKSDISQTSLDQVKATNNQLAKPPVSESEEPVADDENKVREAKGEFGKEKLKIFLRLADKIMQDDPMEVEINFDRVGWSQRYREKYYLLYVV